MASSLVKQTDERWQQVGWALSWLFSCTGNTLIDCDDEALAEIEPLAWDVENVAFAIEIMTEADGILKDAAAGLVLLEAQPKAFHVLSENVDRAYRKLTHRKDKNREPHIRLRWPSLDPSPDGTAVAGADFYSFGVMLLKREGEQVAEYPVDPAQVALALAAKVCFDTGLLSGNTLLVRHEGVKKTVVEYRAPQKTGLYLEGSESAIRVPLPALVFIRATTEDKNPQYRLFAVKKRPSTLDAPLFHAPLPNVFNTGTICWGSVPSVSRGGAAGCIAGGRLARAARLALWRSWCWRQE